MNKKELVALLSQTGHDFNEAKVKNEVVMTIQAQVVDELDEAIEWLRKYADSRDSQSLKLITKLIERRACAVRSAFIGLDDGLRTFNRKKPRKKLTKSVNVGSNTFKKGTQISKEMLVAFEEEFKRKYGRTTGWISAAQLEFGISDSRTLHDILNEGKEKVSPDQLLEDQIDAIDLIQLQAEMCLATLANSKKLE